MEEKKLVRSQVNKMICGVCGGIGEYNISHFCIPCSDDLRTFCLLCADIAQAISVHIRQPVRK